MIEKKEYTTDMHIERLVEILSSDKEICSCCPATEDYSGRHSCSKFWTNSACEICMEFVGLTAGIMCPCITLGEEEALKITLLKLEEEGITI